MEGANYISTTILYYEGQKIELPLVTGTESEIAIDCGSLRAATGAITLDPGYGNTGSCTSAVPFIDGESGVLRYRGYPIEELAKLATFPEVCYLLIYGELPSKDKLEEWREGLCRHSLIHEKVLKFFEGFHPNAHPMAILSAMVSLLSTYYPDVESKEDATDKSRGLDISRHCEGA